MTEEDVGAWMMHCHVLQHMIMGLWNHLGLGLPCPLTHLLTNLLLGMQTVWVFGNASSILAKFPNPPFVNGYLDFGGDAYGNDTYDPMDNYS